MSKAPIDEVISRIRNGENLEVIGYEGDMAVVEKVKGIVKGEFAKEELSELKKRRPRGGPTEEQLELAAEVAKRLAEARKMFKVIFWP